MSTELERYKEAMAVAIDTIRELRHQGVAHASRPDDIKQIAKSREFQINAILNPSPEYEEVEVVAYAIYAKDRSYTIQDAEPYESEITYADGTKAEVVKLTGTLRRPKPQKVERSVSVEARVSSTGANGGGYVTSADDKGHYNCIAFYSHPECHGKTGTLTFTWTEEGEGK